MMPTPTPAEPRAIAMTRDRDNIALSLQLLTLYAPLQPRVLLHMVAFLQGRAVPTFAEYVRALRTLKN